MSAADFFMRTNFNFKGATMFRRQWFAASAALALAAFSSACANRTPTPAPTPVTASVTGPMAHPPIVFVHGNGDSGAVWQNVIWWFESNGWPRDRLFALQHPYPLARDDDNKGQGGRSSTAEHMAFVKNQVDAVLAQTGATQVVLVGNSRGGYAIRNYIQNGGGDKTVSHAILGGTPNHGVWSIEGQREGSEFAGTGQFLKGLNAPKNEAGDEVVGPVKWLTLRSDNNDKFAQFDGLWIGTPGKPTGIGFDGPELKGAQNRVLPRVDHRETSFSPQAFDATYRFITGDAPKTLAITSESKIMLNGMVTGLGARPDDRTTGNLTNNLAIPKASIEVYAVHPATGLRVGDAVHSKTLGADGRWGPLRAIANVPYEFVVRAPGYATTHIYRSPFPRSSDVVHLRADRIANADLPAFSLITLNRPRGYLDPSNNHIKFDGQFPPPGISVQPSAGVATSKIALKQTEDRPIVAEFHTDTVERIVGRTWSAKDNHTVWLEISQ
jgi:triacylglycerol lipase